MNAPLPDPIDLAREPDFRIGALEVRPSTREVVAGEAREVLEPRVMQVLTALARRRGEVVSRDELVAACWGGRVVGEDAIQRAVGVVRRLGETHQAFAVETIARVGYRLSEAGAATGRPKRSPRLMTAVIAVVALVGVAVAGAWYFLGRAAPPARVAVLPFEANGPVAQAFATGLLDETLSVLSANQTLAVSRTESAALRATDAAAIKRLGAALLLDGAVSEADGKIKVRAHLDDAATRTILWSEDFERPVAEAEPLQAEVAARATRLAAYALQAKAAGPLSDAAVSDYITGIEHIRFTWIGGGQEAEPILRRVVQQAPQFAGGHAQLAVSLVLQVQGGAAQRSAEMKAEALREAHRAVALDPRGYGAYAVFAWLTPDLASREAVWRKGMAMDPGEAGYPYLLGGDLMAVGQLKAAAENERRAVALDPLWPGPNLYLGLTLLETGHQSEGLAVFERMAELWPRHEATRAGRFWAVAMYGDPDKALSLLADERTTPAAVSPAGLALWRQFLLAVKSGAPADRARTAKALEAGERAHDIAAGSATAMLARLGDIDGAFAAAKDLLAGVGPAEFIEAPYLSVSATEPMRRDPRFLPLLAPTGVLQFWLTTGQWPDGCADDCKAAVAKLAAAAKR
jgi:DNA-binding winged helix-turn-helix (wHTH) protein/TolB-like protein